MVAAVPKALGPKIVFPHFSSRRKTFHGSFLEDFLPLIGRG
jgi:hypothetical protein